MNKKCYCLIFSRTHGELRVVSELARGCGTRTGQRRGSDGPRLWVTVRRAVWLLGLALFTGSAVAQGIVADGQAAPALRPDVITTQNGLPQVNITAPNQAGISHNQYQQFDVAQQGAILNNSAKMTATQLAGYIQGNPKLDPNAAPARVILNEINSSNPSQLRGHLEVAGGKAKVIVANPAGIVCDGCGTINAGRMTLTTGKPQLNADGSLAGYQVERGAIRVTGGGLNNDARNETEYVDLLARVVEINAGIRAKEAVAVIAGRNRIDVDASQVSPLSASDDDAPELAIDMGQMGGMYSGGVRMIATEAGVGVRNQGGHLQVGKTLTVSSEGRLLWQTAAAEPYTQAGGDITLAARDSLEHQGKLYSGGQLSVHSREGSITQSGTLAAAGNVTLRAKQAIHSSGHLLAGSDVESRLVRPADLTLASEAEIRAGGSLLSQSKITISGRRVDISQSRVAAKEALLTAQQGGVALKETHVDSRLLIVNSKGNIDSQQAQIRVGSWKITADSLFNQTGIWTQTEAAESFFALTGDLDNTDGSIEASQLQLESATLINRRGRLIALGDDRVSWRVSGLLDNQSGTLGSNGDLRLETGGLANQSGSVQSQSVLSLRARDGIINDHGNLLSGSDLRLSGTWLSNREEGLINSQRRLDLNLAGELDNQHGQIISMDSSSIQARTLSNQQGEIQSLATLDMTIADTLDNRGGNLFSQRAQHLQAGNIVNSENGKISGLTTLWLQSERQAQTTGLVDNAGGKILAGERLQIDAWHIDNQQHGLLYSEGLLKLTLADRLDNRSGSLKSSGDIQLDAATLLNDQGAIDSQQKLAIQLAGVLDNRQGSLRADQAMRLVASQIENGDGLVSSSGTLQITTGELNNRAGTIVSQAAGLYQLETLNNQQGRLHSGGPLTVSSGTVDNRGGQLVSVQALSVESKLTDNSANGIVSSQQALVIQADQVINRDGGRLIGTTHTSVTAGSLDNRAGRVQSRGALTLTLLQTLNNQQGLILSSLDLHIGGGDLLALLNQGGNIQSDGALSATSASLDNQGGTLLSQQALTLDLQQDYVHRAGETLNSNSKLILTIGGTLTNLADWPIAGDLQLTSQRFTNQALLVSKGAQIVTGLLLNQGRVEADRLTLQTDSLDNQATLMGDEIMVNSRILDNHGGAALIAATEKLSLQTGERLTNRDRGFIYSGGTLRLHSVDLIENFASDIEAEGDVTLEARRFTNQREGLEIEREAELSDYKWHRYNYYWRSYGSTVNTDLSTMAPVTQQLTFQDDSAAENNRYGTLVNIDAAAKRVEVKLKNNRGELINLWVNYLALTPNADGSYSMTFYETQGPRQNSVPTPYHNTVWREHDRGRIELWDPESHMDIAAMPYVTDYNNFRERTATGTVTTDKLISAGTGARLLAGGAMTLNVSEQLLNDASTISANGSLTIEGAGDVINRGYSVNERRQEYLVDHYDKDTVHWYPTFNLDETTALAAIDGIISGFGKGTITGASLKNTTVNQAQISKAEAAQNAAEAERARWERNPLADDIADRSETLKLTGQQHLATVATDIPDNALFRQQAAAGSAYLIVTDARFTDKGNFISSDYMLKLIGYDPSQVHKRLGDGYYEQRVVREQLLMLTGRPSLRGEDAMAQYQALMNNGSKVAKDFQLIPGVALTPAQIAALEQDIVWLVSETVRSANGLQTVWVPKVYLANTTLRLSGDGALIAGGELQLSTNSVGNAGNLFADKAFDIDTSQFLHQGGDIRADSINVKAGSLSLSSDLQNALRQASMGARKLTLIASDISLKGANLNASENLSLSASNSLSIGAARSSKTADLEVIAGATGNRKSAGMEEPGKRMAQVSGEWQQALGSSLTAGGNLNLQAGQDITLQGSQAQAGGQLNVRAGGNVSLLTETTTNDTHLQAGSRTSSVSNSRQEERLTGSVLNGEGGVTLQAGGDFTAVGAQVASGGGIKLSAQQVTIEEARQQISDQDSEHNRVGKTKSQRERETASNTGTGSVFSARDDITLIAREGDIRVQGSSVESEKGATKLKAAGDIAAIASQDEFHLQEQGSSKAKKMLSRKESSYQREEQSSTASGSLIGGQSVALESGRDISVAGSTVVATDDVSLTAKNAITVTTAENRHRSESGSQSKKSGLSGTGGIGVQYGKNEQKAADSEQSLTHTGSTVGSTQGNVTLKAGDSLTVKGSDVLAGKNISLSGKAVSILAAEKQSSQTHKTEQKQSGLTLALSGTAGSALNAAVTTAKQVKEESDGRVAGLQGMKAALDGVSATQAARLDAAKGDDPANNATVGVNVSYGSRSSKSESSLTQSTQQGSSLTAGGNLNITATGSGVKGQDGDITVQGSRLQTGKDMLLSANRDVNLVSAEESSITRSRNSSKGGSVGVGVTAGSGGAGFNVSANVNKGKGHENANGVSHVETQINAGNQVTITSGRDTALTGAQVNGEAVKLEVGRNLTLTSEQDGETFDSKQQDAGAGAGYTFGAGTATASVNTSRDKMHGDWRSVTEQTGIFVGKGGFDITVGEHTQLDGAVIGSTATADRNRLDTGTLGWRNTENHAEYKVEHAGAGISTGGSIGSQFEGNMASNILAGLNGSDSASSTTHSAVSEGTIVVRERENQRQDVADLSRDVDNANPGLAQIFDAEKERNRLRAAQLIAEIGSRAMGIARTEGQIAGEKAKRDPAALAAAREQLADSGKPFTDADVAKQAYNSAMAPFGTGSALQQGISAATAAIQGLAGGDIGQAISGAAAPYLAEQIHVLTEGNPEAKAMAHAVVGAVASYASGNGAVAGAAGAVSGELMAGLVMKQLYPDKAVSELTETEKQTISALGTLAAGLAGGVVGDSTGNAVAGAQAGKNAAEFNWLNSKEARQLDKEMQDCKGSGGDCNKVVEKYIEISNKNSKELQEACTGGGVTCVTWQELIQGATNVANDANPSQIRLDEKLKDPSAAALVNYLNGTDLKFLEDNITTGDRVMSAVMDPTSWPVAIMGGKAIITNTVNNTKEQLIAVGVAGAANAGIQYGITGEIKLSDVIGSIIVGGITTGKGYNPTVSWNAAGGYYQAKISGGDPIMAALMSTTSSGAGYKAGNILKVPFDKIFNPVSKQYEWVSSGVWTISKSVPQSSVPSVAGNVADSLTSGFLNPPKSNNSEGKK
ncbi:hemagglutinin repeat-containing protein [Erwinia sp. 198]|uniref:hemagglutinin repeat-containing protein n=1 Tax=Erwinia sp. 198 TaxID=2022746 RepID=UPI000F679500|nr:hemagglutinin repeat-containing protein [Erwinia sp. 198]RRZ97076.1 filamentous hemagglutinin N-terminal domain-containing protein [Erwinia sp. 198]